MFVLYLVRRVVKEESIVDIEYINLHATCWIVYVSYGWLRNEIKISGKNEKWRIWCCKSGMEYQFLEKSSM